MIFKGLDFFVQAVRAAHADFATSVVIYNARYRGIAKNTNRAIVACALSNLYMARRYLMRIPAKMSALKARGVSFSLDDFGTGYSSLSYLKRLPLDQLKIDKSFVEDILIDRSDAAIARTVIALSENLGMTVIAEGVESNAQKVMLSNIGCHSYQGYLFSKPVILSEFEKLVPQRLC